MRYAADLARLTSQGADDRRLDELERRLEQVSQACVGLARASSVEDAAERLARAAVDLLGLERAGVYLLRKERPMLAATYPLEATFPASDALSVTQPGGGRQPRAAGAQAADRRSHKHQASAIEAVASGRS